MFTSHLIFQEVSQWLESVGLPMYCHAFLEHEISGTELLSLERRDFKDVGVTKVRKLALFVGYVRHFPEYPKCSIVF